MAEMMPNPLTVTCSSKIQIGFIFLVPAHPGSSRQRATEQVSSLLYIMDSIAVLNTARATTHTSN